MPSRPSHSKEWNSPSAMRLASGEEFAGDTRKVPGGRPAPEGGEGRRNVEVMWLLGRLAPDHKTIATFARACSQTLAAPETRVEAEGVGVKATVV